MFTITRTYTRDGIPKTQSDQNDIALLPSEALPARYTLEDLFRELAKADELGDDKEKELDNLLILASCLEEKSNIEKRIDDGNWREKIESYLAEILLPDGKTFSLDKNDVEDESNRNYMMKHHRSKYSLCVISIFYLFEDQPSELSPPKHSTFLSLIPFTNAKSPWATSRSQQFSEAILDRYKNHAKSYDFLVTYLLKSFIRPIFSKTPAPASITAHSRKAAPSSAPPRHFDINDSSSSSQPWRSNAPYTIPVLQWIIESMPQDMLREQFPLLIPPVLKLLDSSSNSIRVHTLQFLPILFSRMGQKLLLQTGLGEVFESAIHPVLLFLPTLTPVEDTINLLPAGYEALYALCDARWPDEEGVAASNSVINIPDHITNTSKSPTQLRLAFLDQIVRHCILPAHLHCQEIPAVVEILISQIGIIISKMKIWGVKHLKDVLPIISNILMNPFFPDTSPSLVLTTLTTLRQIILVLWPRISIVEHRFVILQALGSLYYTVRLNEDENVGEKVKVYGEIRTELQKTGRVFTAAAVQSAEYEEAKQSFAKELVALYEVDEGLISVFGYV